MDNTGLLSALILIMATMIYGFVHSLLASGWAKEKTQRLFGIQSQRWYRLAYNLFAIISFLPVIWLMRFLPDRSLYTIPLPWLFISLFLQGVAGLALIVGLFQTGVNSFLGFQQLLQTSASTPAGMLTTGLYRYVRHPLYTAGFIFIWLTPKMTMNILALNIGLTLYLLMGTFVEERKLVKEFGEPYQLYQRETPVFIPWKWKRKV
jgi:protein-S-isoprenylcysteine O-methyltransferase Ste14